MKKDSKTQLLDHSQAKVRLLGEYLKRYLNIIVNDRYTERIKIYDLFCGEGTYENLGEGSPLVIMRQVKDIHFINQAKLNKIPPIDCSFNDIEKAKVEKVKQSIKDKSLYYPSFGEIEYTSNEYSLELSRLMEIIPKLRKQKAFIFIDPYGYKHIRASDIKNLLAKGNSEVLLFLPTQFMYRFDSNGTPESLKDFIEEITSYKDWRENDSVWKFIEQLKDGFKNYLEDKFVDTFTIQKDPQTVFCIFFFSSHIKGFEKMLEAKWEIDTEQGKGWNFTNNTPSLFVEQKTNPLEEKLYTFLEEVPRYNGELYEFTLRAGFLTKHINEIFYNWQNNNKVEVVTSNGQKARKGAFYIDYKHFKEDNKRAKFKLTTYGTI